MSKYKKNTAPCRFCGQIRQLEDAERTEEQAIEEATTNCDCLKAVMYRKEKRRKEKAMQNVDTLFAQEEEGIEKLLKAAVDLILEDQMEKITLNLYGGVKATISQNSKGEINVERTVTRKQKLSE